MGQGVYINSTDSRDEIYNSRRVHLFLDYMFLLSSPTRIIYYVRIFFFYTARNITSPVYTYYIILHDVFTYARVVRPIKCYAHFKQT